MQPFHEIVPIQFGCGNLKSRAHLRGIKSRFSSDVRGSDFSKDKDIVKNGSNGDRFRKWKNGDEGQEQNGQEKKIRRQPTLIP